MSEHEAGSVVRDRVRTPVVQSRTDVNVRPLRGAQVGKSGLDSVVCSDLLSQDGQRVVAWRVTAMVATRTVSISMTVLNPFSDSLEIGARKFPAAPALSRAREKRSASGQEGAASGGRTHRR